MARIWLTDKKKVSEIRCMSDGQDMMCDIIGGNDNEGQYATTRDDADFEMPEADFLWWEDWAEREERILRRANELGEEAIDGVARLGTEYCDLDLLHAAQERYLGLR